MWQKGWRQRVFSQLDQEWDVVIIGGGITGAGILREATNAGLRTLLVDARDFGFGTSSRSSKSIHGGIRYLRNRQFRVTYESVQEREWLLREAAKLVTPLSFLLPIWAENAPFQRGTGLQILTYDLMAPKWRHRSYSKDQLLEACPQFRRENLLRGYAYEDALMDDTRFLFRLIREAVQAGGVAINYARAEDLLKTQAGQVCGIVLRDAAEPDGKTYEVKARVVINASGPWSDDMRKQIGAPARLRKLRGSHLIFPREVLPSEDIGFTLVHPKNARTMFAFGWEGVTLIGTTDLDHDPALEQRQSEPCASVEEIDYIMEGLQFTFPQAGITREHIISSFAGLRPVINTGKARPSDESREHVVSEENGMLTITGGKYTTFRVMAQHVLKMAAQRLPGNPVFPTRRRFFNPLPDNIPPALAEVPGLSRLQGRFGDELAPMAEAAQPGELAPIPGQLPCWAELRWAARCEGVVHLDDLLLRRVRLGMTAPQGGLGDIEKIQAIVQPELGWDDQRWMAEVAAYRKTWQQAYSPAPTG